MADCPENLLRRVTRFEESLRAAWDLDRPGLPRHLRPYHRAWCETLARPLANSSQAELRRFLGTQDPLLVSDYHPLPRARRDLAATLSLLPPEQDLLLVLELLPAGITISAAEALRDQRTRLATGTLLRDAYRPVLEVLSRRGGTITGAWQDHQAMHRDRAAAELWASAVRPGQRTRWVFHFGDWHLADAHLPAQLRARGASPRTLHLSAEPIWRRVGLRPHHHVLELTEVQSPHAVWLRTPPLGLWASQVAEEMAADPAELAEGTEHLIEATTESWSAALGMRNPELRMSVHTRSDWREFRSLLPADWRNQLEEAPEQVLFHPRLPLMYLPHPPGLNAMMEAAQHLLLCDSPLRDAESAQAGVLQQAWRSLGAALVNPFLRAPRWLDAARALWPSQPQADLLARARASDPAHAGSGRVAHDLPLELLQSRVWGSRCGIALANWQELDANFLAKFLQTSGGVLEPRILAATLRAA